jgi:hypothetical protein
VWNGVKEAAVFGRADHEELHAADAGKRQRVWSVRGSAASPTKRFDAMLHRASAVSVARRRWPLLLQFRRPAVAGRREGLRRLPAKSTCRSPAPVGPEM